MKLVDKVMTILGLSVLFLGFSLLLMNIVEGLIFTTIGTLFGIILPDWGE